MDLEVLSSLVACVEEKIDRKIEQFELMLEEIEASRAEAELRSGKAPLPELDDASDKPKRKPLPDGLPTEELVYAAPCNCPTCGGTSFLKAADRVVQVKLAEAMRYALSRWAALSVYIDDGRVEIDNNIAERAMRPLGIGRKNWLFAGSDKGGERIANILTIIETAKLHGHNPEVYLTDVLTRIQSHPKDRLQELLPWQWVPAKERYEAA
ncbi:hypothetical protein QO004_000115 [Rhizobium mesoamericanum]|nr:hypothetical protein [Rhizobium mesoamericanum]